MDTEAICIISSLITGGVIAIALGIWTRLGKNRAWYLVPNYYVLLPKSGHYALPIIGLMLIVLGISLLMPKPELVRRVWAVGVFPLGIIAVLVVVFQPKWLKPKWVRWLEENHGDILDLLIEEARKTPKWTDWAKQVSTQKGLEEWVAEVRRKHGL
jgi:hypothetical protein